MPDTTRVIVTDHAIERGKERYGDWFTRDDAEQVILAIRARRADLVSVCADADVYLYTHKGIVMAPKLLRWNGALLTFQPRDFFTTKNRRAHRAKVSPIKTMMRVGKNARKDGYKRVPKHELLEEME